MAAVAGVDEAGRGPVLGPLVVAAAAVDDPDELAGLGVRDSKRLTPDRRVELDRRIRDRCRVAVRTIDAASIDAARRDRSLNAIEVELFAEAAGSLDAGRVVADAADVDADRFGQALAARLDGIDVVAEHGADDRHPVVSAASIVAKVARDRRMAEIAEELDRPVGSGYPSDRTTVDFLDRWIADHGDLPPHTRRSWASAERALARARQTSLSDY